MNKKIKVSIVMMPGMAKKRYKLLFPLWTPEKNSSSVSNIKLEQI